MHLTTKPTCSPMKYLLYVILGMCLMACTRKAQQQASIEALDSLSAMPYDTTLILGEGITVRRLSPTQVLLSQPRQRQGKTKYKNVGNTDVKQKDVGNVAIGKKAGQQQDVGNAEIKDVGNVEQKSQSYWWLWLILIAGVVILLMPKIRFL